MRTHTLIAATGLVLVACANSPLAPTATVVGRGNPEADIAAVQQAVDAGGKVLLKGRFDFGPSGSVRITRDVAISGETDGAGKPVTLIHGGHATLRSIPPQGQFGPGPKVVIENLQFDGATNVAIRIGYASGGAIRNNVIRKVRPVLFPPEPPTDKPFYKQRGIVLGTVSDPDRTAGYVANAVTGRFEIAGNDIDLVNDDPKNTMGHGIFALRTTGIDLEVARNAVRNASRNAIEAIDNMQGPGGSGRVLIRDNHVETPTEGIMVPGPATPNGIALGYTIDTKAGADSTRRIAHTASNNRVLMHGRMRYSNGIIAAADGAVVTGNEVISDTATAVGIAVYGPNGTIRDNRFRGTGLIGIVVVPAFAALAASNNEIANNDFTALKASIGHVSLNKGSSRNRVLGSKGTFVDQGEANVTEGMELVRR